MPTETNAHRDALCFLVMAPSLLHRLAVGGWRRLAVGGWRRLAVGGWRLAVGGPWGLSLSAVLRKEIWLLKDSPGVGVGGARDFVHHQRVLAEGLVGSPGTAVHVMQFSPSL